MLRAIESISYYHSRRIPLAQESEVFLDGYFYTNQLSITVLLVVALLKFAGRKVYYLPDGVLELANTKRFAAILGFVTLKLSDAILVGDDISERVGTLLKKDTVRVRRWEFDRNYCSECKQDFNVASVVLTIAKTPAFSRFEELRLINVLTDFDNKNKTVQVQKYYGFVDGKLRSKRVFEKLRDSKKYLVVSTISTVLLESVCLGHKVGVLGFRGYESECGIKLWPNLYGLELVFSDFDTSHRVIYGQCWLGYVYAFEARVKKISKEIYCKLYKRIFFKDS